MTNCVRFLTHTPRFVWLVGAGLMASWAQAGCTLPPAPNKIPNGATASDEAMRAVMIAMADYETDVNNYIKCLAFELSQGRLAAQAEERMRNDALNRHQEALNRYNAQIRLYMAR